MACSHTAATECNDGDDRGALERPASVECSILWPCNPRSVRCHANSPGDDCRGRQMQDWPAVAAAAITGTPASCNRQ